MDKKNQIINLIELLRENIFDYNLKEMYLNIDNLINMLSSYEGITDLTKGKLDILNTILDNVNISIENGDYMLLSDILKFDLKHFLNNL